MSFGFPPQTGALRHTVLVLSVVVILLAATFQVVERRL